MNRRSSFQPRRMRSPYLNGWYIAWCISIGALLGALVVVAL